MARVLSGVDNKTIPLLKNLFLFSAQKLISEADMDEFRAGIHNDRGFGNNFRSERGQAA